MGGPVVIRGDRQGRFADFRPVNASDLKPDRRHHYVSRSPTRTRKLTSIDLLDDGANLDRA
jgi:hypothetical protein